MLVHSSERNGVGGFGRARESVWRGPKRRAHRRSERPPACQTASRREEEQTPILKMERREKKLKKAKGGGWREKDGKSRKEGKE